ncbi:hypothetical protein BH24ACT23_BH24ACT23_01180 [soil metagenome]
MRRFRIRRRRALALALLPTVVMIGSTPTLAAETGTRDATLSGKGKVRFGDRVTLRGKFPDSPRTEVRILRRTAKDEELKPVASTTTNDMGVWSARVKPRKTAIWRARLVEAEAAPEDGSVAAAAAPTADRESNARRIRVKSVTNVRPAKRHTVVGHNVKLKGRVLPAGSKRRVKVEVGSRTIRTRTNRRGRFAVRWNPSSTGDYKVKARAKRNRDAAGSGDRGGRVTAYRYAHASWYGPGFYGNRTACGQTLTSSTRGVAHKSLPCGTKLRLRYRSRTVTVRVIDRGPYVAGREFDLTRATKDDLGFGSTGTILSSR